MQSTPYVEQFKLISSKQKYGIAKQEVLVILFSLARNPTIIYFLIISPLP
jgi:hypothetical protein